MGGNPSGRPAARADGPSRTRVFSWPRLLVALALGAATTVGLAAALALWQPLDGTSVILGTGGTITQRVAPRPSITISADGDHLEPWHILLELPGARREVWFEKGRVYNRFDGQGRPLGHPQSSISVVSCWSFATAMRPLAASKQPLPVSEQITALTHCDPPKAWGVAIDRRGWPLHAFEGRIVGTMDPSAPQPWVIAEGVDIDGVSSANPQAPGTGWRSSHLGMVRMIPMRPLWTGVLADTAIFAAAWYGLLLVPAALLARLRRMVGCCAGCGYDLSGLPPGAPCPECGRGRPGDVAPGSADTAAARAANG